MLRKQRLMVVVLGVAVTVLGNAAFAVRAGEEDWQKLIHELNSTTGKEVIAAQQQALRKHPDAKKLIQFARNLVKKDDKALTFNGAYLLANLARHKKQVAASEAFYRICAKQAAELESTQKLLQAYGGLIELFFDSKKYKECEKVCREVLELETGPANPREVIVYEFEPLAPANIFPDQMIPDKQPNYDSARPLHFLVQRLMVQCISKQKRYDEALKLAQKLAAQRDHWLTQELVASVLREAGRAADAAKAYEEILKSVQNDPNLDAEDKADYEDRYRYILSGLYVETKQILKGTEQLRILVNRHPEEPGYLNDLGYIWADHDMNLEEAEKLIRKAIDLDRKKRKDNPALEDRENGAYLDSLGWVLYKQKKYKEAKEWLLKAIEDDRAQHIEIYDHLGDVSFALGEREAALKYWQKGVGLAGDSRRDQERKTRVMEKIKKHSDEGTGEK